MYTFKVQIIKTCWYVLFCFRPVHFALILLEQLYISMTIFCRSSCAAVDLFSQEAEHGFLFDPDYFKSGDFFSWTLYKTLNISRNPAIHILLPLLFQWRNVTEGWTNYWCWYCTYSICWCIGCLCVWVDGWMHGCLWSVSRLFAVPYVLSCSYKSMSCLIIIKIYFLLKGHCGLNLKCELRELKW